MRHCKQDLNLHKACYPECSIAVLVITTTNWIDNGLCFPWDNTFHPEQSEAIYYQEMTRLKTWLESLGLSLWRTPACQTQSKALDISRGTAWVASNSLRYNYVKICSWTRRPETIVEIRKKGHVSRDYQHTYYLQTFQRLDNNRKKAKRVVAFRHESLPNILKHRDTDKTFQQLGNKILSNIYWRNHLISMKVQIQNGSCGKKRGSSEKKGVSEFFEYLE